MISIEDREINLEPVSVISGEVPTWVGEEIPVEYHVAREAGSLRNRSPKGYSINGKAMKCALAPINKQRGQNLPIPDHKHVVAELFSDFLVIHSTFGLKVNQTLGRFFSTILSARSGHSVSLKVDPYRIILQAKDLSTDRVEELFSTDPTFIEPLLSASLKRTSIFKWKFVHTARRFGALSRDVDFKSLSLNRFIRAWENSLIEKEVVNDIFTSNLDIKNATKVLEGLNEGGIGLEIFRLSDPTPLAEAGMESFTEVVLPKRAERMILRALKNRIEGKRVTLFCAYCGKWQDNFVVKNIPQDIKCGNCGARMLAPLTYKPRESIKSFRKYKGGEKISRGEQKEIKRIQNLGGLFLSYGKLLPEVLAARGVGPEVAKRVLRDSRTDEELYRNILKSERNYARTKKFWD
jgi:ATP-dependent Lhr-like helicase